MRYRILIIDEDVRALWPLCDGLSSLGHEVEAVSDIREAMRLVKSMQPDLILLDERIGERQGADGIESIKNGSEDIRVAVTTDCGTMEKAVEAMRLGACDYLIKPMGLDSARPLISRCMGGARRRAGQSEKSADTSRAIERYTLVGDSPSMHQVRRQIDVVSRNDRVDVLVRGETGTGKEVVANQIHYSSSRRDMAIVKINCGAIPENLLESELFGYERGAFTGALKTKRGLLELADGGTVFLDEIGELPLAMQAKLLNFMEDRRFKRVGGLSDIEVDVRVIAATNRDLKLAIERKEFREDLFYRLNVMQIEIAPLRERSEDILPLCRFFIERFNKKYGKNIKSIEPAFAKELESSRWKGNVRELRNVIERCVIFCEGDVLGRTASVEDLHEDAEACPPVAGDITMPKHWPIDLAHEMKLIELRYIEHAMRLCDNNYSRAAQLLGMTRFTLRRRVEEAQGAKQD